MSDAFRSFRGLKQRGSWRVLKQRIYIYCSINKINITTLHLIFKSSYSKRQIVKTQIISQEIRTQRDMKDFQNIAVKSIFHVHCKISASFLKSCGMCKIRGKSMEIRQNVFQYLGRLCLENIRKIKYLRGS